MRKKPELEAKRLEIQTALTKIVGEEDIVADESRLLSYHYSALPEGIPLRRTTVAKGAYVVVMADFAVYPETTDVLLVLFPYFLSILANCKVEH